MEHFTLNDVYRLLPPSPFPSLPLPSHLPFLPPSALSWRALVDTTKAIDINLTIG
jgi:hypothetical protein